MNCQKTFLDLFSGIGLHCLGLERAGWKCVGQCEIDEFCSKVLAKHWPNVPRWKDVKDVTAASVKEACGCIPDIVTGGFPCFPKGTLVETSTGPKPIEEIQEGEMVLTHLGRFRKVLKTMSKNVSSLLRIRAFGYLPFFVTDEHPFFVRKKHVIGKRGERKRAFREPCWVKASELDKNCHLAQPLWKSPSTSREWEGRTVNQHTYYQARATPKAHLGFKEGNYFWVPVREINQIDKCEEVFNLAVEEDNSYVANSFAVHNCQDVSCAGKGEGIGSEEQPTENRSGLWWQMKRVIEELGPPWVLVENVPALKQRGVDEVLKSLENLGYQCWPLVVGAWAAGAPHLRNRVWIVATNRQVGLVNTCVGKLGEIRWPMSQGPKQFDWEHPRTVKSTRGDDPGARSNQIKALGNANPPHVPEALGRAIRNCLEAQSGEVLCPEQSKDKDELMFTPPVDEDSKRDRYSQVGWLLRTMMKSLLPARGAWKRTKTPKGRDWWAFCPLGKSKGAWHTPLGTYGNHPGITSTTHLPGQAIMWATPRASDASHGGPNQRDSAGNYALPAQVFHVGDAWPTPRASEHKDCGPKGSKSQRHMLGKKYLCATVSEIEGHDPSKGTYKLSPAWEAQLMGAPEGWLDLKGKNG